jgi:hypothetical protein
MKRTTLIHAIVETMSIEDLRAHFMVSLAKAYETLKLGNHFDWLQVEVDDDAAHKLIENAKQGPINDLKFFLEGVNELPSSK